MMKKIVLIMTMLFYVGSVQTAQSAQADQPPTVSVLADQSLSVPLSKLAQHYAKKHQASVSNSFESVQRHEEQVVEGVHYDILITAHPRLLESLKLQGLIDVYSKTPLARNRLVIATTTGNDFTASFYDQFPLAKLITQMEYRPALVLGNPETLLEGSVAREALRNYGVLADLESYTLYEKNLSDAIDLVKEISGFTMLYESELRQFNGMQIIGRIPEEKHTPITYYAVVLAGDNMTQARDFIEFLGHIDNQPVWHEGGLYRP